MVDIERSNGEAFGHVMVLWTRRTEKIEVEAKLPSKVGLDPRACADD